MRKRSQYDVLSNCNIRTNRSSGNFIYLVLLKEVREALRSHRGIIYFDFSHETEVSLTI